MERSFVTLGCFLFDSALVDQGTSNHEAFCFRRHQRQPGHTCSRLRRPRRSWPHRIRHPNVPAALCIRLPVIYQQSSRLPDGSTRNGRDGRDESQAHVSWRREAIARMLRQQQTLPTDAGLLHGSALPRRRPNLGAGQVLRDEHWRSSQAAASANVLLCRSTDEH
jgi:hypothetical protein